MDLPPYDPKKIKVRGTIPPGDLPLIQRMLFGLGMIAKPPHVGDDDERHESEQRWRDVRKAKEWNVSIKEMKHIEEMMRQTQQDNLDAQTNGGF